MPIIQSDHAKGRKQAPYAAEAGNVVTARYEVDLDAAASGDVVELGILPAYCRATDALLVTDGLGGTVTASAGVMSGTPGDADDTRTVGNELFAAADVAANGLVRLSKTDMLLLAASETDTPVGLTVSEAATGKVVLLLQYAAYGDY